MKIKRYLITTNRIFEELYQTRDLKVSEKGKSLDYWEGYTSAVAKLTTYLLNYEESKK